MSGEVKAEEGPLPKWEDIHGLNDKNLDVLVELANGLQDEIGKLDAERKDVMAQIMAAIDYAGTLKVQVGEFPVHRLPDDPKGTKTLKKELLIQQGVTKEQLDKATVESPKKGHVLIVRPKQ